MCGSYESGNGPQKQARYHKADEFYQRALTGQENQLGHDHPDTLKTMMSIASSKCDQDDPEAAKALSKRVVTGRETKICPHHPDTLRSIWNLARVCGAYELAEGTLFRALKGQEEQLGPEHPFILKTLKDLAFLRYRQAQVQEAEILFERARAALRKSEGATHAKKTTSSQRPCQCA